MKHLRMTLFGGGKGGRSAYLCAPLRPLLWQESARLYWIITPHRLRVVRAPASLIWQHRWPPPPPRALSLRQKRRQREPRCVSLFFYVYSAVFPSSSSFRVSECLSTSRHELFICTPPPPGPNPRLCVAAVPVRPRGIALYCIGRTLLSHMCVILSPPAPCNNSAFIVHPQYSSCSFTDLVSSFFLQKLSWLSHITAAPFPIQRDLNSCFFFFFYNLHLLQILQVIAY